MQNKIDEIMGLVKEYGEACMTYGAGGSHVIVLTDKERAIESKLRELVREPLSSQEILNAFKLSVFVDNSQISSFVAGVRYAERAHGITKEGG